MQTTYNPVAHARALFDRGKPNWALEVLSAIPPQYLQDDKVGATVDSEKMLCLLAMDQPGSPYAAFRLFFETLSLFYNVIRRAPDHYEAFLTQAEFWHRIGNDAMARRTLRILEETVKADDLEPLRSRYTAPAPHYHEAAPIWSGAWHPRILLIMLAFQRAHYGLDVFYDGLCSILGDASICEYPWKPSLHGAQPELAGHYPCLFDRAGTPMAFRQVKNALENGEFDLVFFATLDTNEDPTEARALIRAAGDLPLFVLDAGDDCVDNIRYTREFLDCNTVRGYFKRESLAGAQYTLNTFPFPFAYPDSRVMNESSGPRPNDFFWAGNRTFGMRSLYLERIEKLLGRRFDQHYEPQEYLGLLDPAVPAADLGDHALDLRSRAHARLDPRGGLARPLETRAGRQAQRDQGHVLVDHRHELAADERKEVDREQQQRDRDRDRRPAPLEGRREQPAVAAGQILVETVPGGRRARPPAPQSPVPRPRSRPPAQCACGPCRVRAASGRP